MKKLLFLFLFLTSFHHVTLAEIQGQARIDSLIAQLPQMKEDTDKVSLLTDLSFTYININPDEGLKYGRQGLELAEKLKWKKGIAYSFRTIAVNYSTKSDNPHALEYFLKALKMFEELSDKTGIAKVTSNIGNVYSQLGDYPKTLEYGFKALKMAEDLGAKKGIAVSLGNIGMAYYSQWDYPKALEYSSRALKIHEELGDKNGIKLNLTNLGNVYQGFSDYPKALEYYFKALKISEELGDKSGRSMILGNIGLTYMCIATYNNKAQLTKLFAGNRIAALHEAKIYTDRSIEIKKEIGDLAGLIDKYKKLSEIQGLLNDYKSALESFKNYSLFKDSVFNMEKEKKLTQTAMQYEFDKKEAAAKAEQEKKDALAKSEVQKQRVVRNFYAGAGIMLLLLTGMLYNRYRLKQKSNKVITNAYNDLKKAQGQLVQSEKMASLGQLTAGIAHEINNPINFVSANVRPLQRNFDEVKIVLDKYETAITKNQLADQFNDVESYKKDVDFTYTLKETETLIKAIHEGATRTTEIVKGLRNFSRLDEGELKKTNINECIESSLMLVNNRLEKRKIELVKFLKPVPEIECYPGEINQVLMNVITNAIDSFAEDTINQTEERKISVSTASENNRVKISIRDNGRGMSEETRQRIFDPFFTTKDVGKGTGLGLSISYGIIEKHKGKIDVLSEMKKGSEFVVWLPLRIS